MTTATPQTRNITKSDSGKTDIMILPKKQNQMWWIQRMFLRLLFLVLLWVNLAEDQNQFMVQAAEVTGSAETVNDPVQPSNHQETNPMSFSFSSRVSTAPLLSSLVVRQQTNNSNNNATTTNPNHWKMQDNRVLILENTTWSAEIVENALILDKTVMVFPGATLIIQGRPLIDSEMTTEQTEEQRSRNNSSSSQEQDNIPMDPFVVAFLDDYDVSISLHPGAHIVLDRVVFWNASHDNKGETNETGHDTQSPGLQTLGEFDDYEGSTNTEDPQPTILARQWQCHFLSQCLFSYGNVGISHSRFHVSGPKSYAIQASRGTVYIHHSVFVTTEGASGLVPNQGARFGRGVTISQSQFVADTAGVGRSSGRYNRYNIAVQVPEHVSLTIDQSTFVGYHKAIVAGGVGYTMITNCTLVGNQFGFLGYEYMGVRSRGRIEDCYFWRNGITQIGHDATRNLYVENVVAYQSPRSVVDLLMYRNMVGFWIAHANDYTNHGVFVPQQWKTWDDIPLNEGRHVSNLTFLDNGVAVLGRILIPSRGGSVNFMNSGWYHVNCTEVATVPLLQDIYWSNDGQTRTVSEQVVREKIRDGFSGGGPGIVQINVTAGPETPYQHSMFWPPSLTNKYAPPTLAEWFQTKQFQPVDPTVVHQTPPLPNTRYLDLPEELAMHNMFDWWGLDEAKNDTSNENPQSHNDDDNNKIVCSPRTDNNHKPELHEDDPQAVIVKIHTAWSTCAQLSASSEEEWQRWCLAPDSMASTVCPRVCACGPMIRNHSDSSVGISEPPVFEEKDHHPQSP